MTGFSTQHTIGDVILCHGTYWRTCACGRTWEAGSLTSAECPVQAIFPDNGVPEKWASYTEKNKKHFENK